MDVGALWDGRIQPVICWVNVYEISAGAVIVGCSEESPIGSGLVLVCQTSSPSAFAFSPYAFHVWYQLSGSLFLSLEWATRHSETSDAWNGAGPRNPRYSELKNYDLKNLNIAIMNECSQWMSCQMFRKDVF